MKTKIKKLIPQPIKDILRPLKKKFYDDAKKRVLFKKMQKKHKQLIEQIKGKEKIKVVFLAIHKSVWKVDPVFKKMLDDPYFEPIILVCPYTAYGEERMWEDMKDTYEYFEDKGYPLLSSYNKDEDKWISLEEIKPDIVFFTNPHDLTRKEYYEDAYMNYLSCYVPYFFLTTTHDDDQSIYNYLFHNVIWKNFMPHEFSFNRMKKVSSIKGVNSLLVGYPFVESFYCSRNDAISVWKEQNSTKIKLIFAPHHTIEDGNLKLSNFLVISEFIKELATKHKDIIQWSFKPHPILKSKLYKHSEWGKEKTDRYYSFWKNEKYTQLDEGEYINLFLQSDGILHDSGSFIAEYLFVEKPCAYLQLNGEVQINSINDFGLLALDSYHSINSLDEVNLFITSVIEGKIGLKSNHLKFIEDYKHNFFNNTSPSDSILHKIKKYIKQEKI